MPQVVPDQPRRLSGARLPRWSLPPDWPCVAGQVALAELQFEHGRIAALAPAGALPPSATDAWNLDGAPVLPGLVDAHTHVDKAFTLHRAAPLRPGLLSAIEAMHKDRVRWTAADVRERATRALDWAFDAGVIRLRTHVDWWEPDAAPLAWDVLETLAAEWAGRIELERVNLTPLALYAERDGARRLARRVAASASGARLGGFVHTVNWNRQALAHLLEAAEEHGLDVDLHIDEELEPAAVGLTTTAELIRAIGFSGRVVCGHACALAAQPEAQALATLDAVAEVAITLVALPITNLLLQDATTGRTPRLRGLTLVKEARARGIPVLLASDNVQDAFCAVGSFDPLEALAAGVLAAQLDEPFDSWSEAICRGDWLGRAPGPPPLAVGAAADLVVFSAASARAWPSRSQPRVVLRDGRVASGSVPAAWRTRSAQATDTPSARSFG